MSDFRRVRLTLDQAMEILNVSWRGEPYIIYDPAVVKQYRVIGPSSTHDGTRIFTVDLLAKTMEGLFKRSSYFKSMGEPPDGMLPFYTIGSIRLVSVFGKVDLPAGRYSGVREGFTIPVKCEYHKV